jgi:transposase
MQHILYYYKNKPDYLFCYDECSGIQTNTPLCPDQISANSGKIYREFEYKRNGTLDLLAFLNVNTGNIFGAVRDDHKTTTLCSIFKNHIQQYDNSSQLHYIMDNLSTHYHNDFCKIIAELSNVKYTPLDTSDKRKEWLGKDDKRIVIHFTPTHGSWLNQIEIWFGILSQKCLKNIFSKDKKEMTDSINNFIDTWNNYFAHPFNWQYTGDGLYQKVINRFNRILLVENDQMDLSFLLKQLLLMSNLNNNYLFEIEKTNEWILFKKLFLAKKCFIAEIIQKSEKPKLKKKALIVLEELVKIINCQN